MENLILSEAGAATRQEAVADIARALAQGVAKALGAEAVDNAFGNATVPSYFNEVYQEISKIVDQALRKDSIEKINASIDSTQDWVRTMYLPHKATGDWSPEDLVKGLQIHLKDTGEALGLLTQPDYAEAGFSVFLIAAGLQLALVQEQTLVDPNAASSKDSTYGLTLRALAQEHYNFVLNTFIPILSERCKYVKIDETFELIFTPMGIPTRSRMWRWEDSFTGEKGGSRSDRDVAERELEEHVVEVCEELAEKLKFPVNIALDWLSLKLGYDSAPLYESETTAKEGYFFDYSTPQDYVGRMGIQGWVGNGTFGWMGGKDGKQPGAEVPVYRLVAESDPDWVRLVFSQAEYAALQGRGWVGSGAGKGLLGYLWRDPSRVPAGTAVEVWALEAPGEGGLARTQLLKSGESYREVQKVGWRPAGGLVGYLCSQG